MKVAYASWHKWPSLKGGVERYGHYVQKAFDAEWIVPGEVLQQAPDIIFSDSGLGLEQPLANPAIKIMFVHGTWKQLHVNCGMSDGPEESAQQAAFRRKDVVLIASSHATAAQLKAHYGLRARYVVNLGIDLKEFKPRIDRQPLNIKDGVTVLHAATDFVKRPHYIRYLENKYPQHRFKLVYREKGNEGTGEAYRRGDVFLHLSHYEGNAYAPAEALACGLPLLTTNVGFFWDNRDPRLGIVLDKDIHPEGLSAAFEALLENWSSYDPRAVAEEHFDYNRWKREYEGIFLELRNEYYCT